MKKQYTFLFMIIIILNLSYKIITFTYKEYKRNSDINYIQTLITKEIHDIKEKKGNIEYQTSKAFRNKVLKEQQSLKNIGEQVIYFTTEEKYKNYTKSIDDATRSIQKVTQEKIDTKEMSIYEKWLYFLFRNESQF